MTDKPYDPSKVVLVVAGEKLDFGGEELLTIDPPPFKKWDIVAQTEKTTTLELFVKGHKGYTTWATVVFLNESPNLKQILDTDPYEFEGAASVLPEGVEYVLI